MLSKLQRKSNSWIMLALGNLAKKQKSKLYSINNDRLFCSSFRCRMTANFHLLQIPSISHSRQALISCAVVYLMNLRIPPKPAIKAILKLKLVRAYTPY